MSTKIDNKLVVVSGTCDGREFSLLEGRTTIGSAPTNDVVLEDKDASGFHAEVRLDNGAWYITDFNSEKGTFLNGERLRNETRLKPGDRIRIGSTNTVFVPLDAIMVKENIGIKDSKIASKTTAFGLRKKRLLALSVIILVLCAIRMIPTNKGDGEADNGRVEDSSFSLPQATAASGEKHMTSSSITRKKENDAKNEGAVGANAGQGPNYKGSGPQDKIAAVTMKIAEKFAAFRLWNEALEHYCKVKEKSPGYPGLKGQIARMNFEIGNKAKFGQGTALIKQGRYEQGIAILKDLPEKSCYYPDAAQEIDNAEKLMTKALKR